MKARLYHDIRKANCDAVDAWTMYFPCPKHIVKSEGVKGVFLGCKPTDTGMIRCCWENHMVGNDMYFGKRVKVEETSIAFQEIFKHFEMRWNQALHEDTAEAWGAWVTL